MNWKYAAAFAALITVGACSETPSAPSTRSIASPSMQKGIGGSGIGVNFDPALTLPLGLGGTISIDQAAVTHFALVENAVGAIVGVDVTGTLTGTAVNAVGGLVGLKANPFTAEASVTSSGPGQCSLASIDLSSLNVNGLGLVTGTVPVNVTGKGSGAVGSLLCNLGSLLSGIGSGLSGGSGAQGVVNALNNQIGG